MTKVSILTAVWNQIQFTAGYLNFLNMYLPADTEVVIFDNGSNDGTQDCLAMWEKRCKWLRIMSSNDNLGFAKANNILARNSMGDYLIFLNNDIRVDGDFISPLVDPLVKDPKQIAGATLYDFDTGWNRFGNTIIPYIGGWCFAMHHTEFDNLGGLDERYGICDYEDIDLSYTAVQNGHALTQVVTPLMHYHGMTGARLGNRQAITEANRIKFAQKWNLSI